MNNSLSDSDHFARYCKPSTVDNGFPTGNSFKIRPKKDDSLSVNWLEYFKQEDVCKNLEEVREIFKIKNFTLRKNGRFAVLNVGYCKREIKLAYNIDIDIKQMPDMIDPSHAGIFSKNLVACIRIAELVTAEDVYPAC